MGLVDKLKGLFGGNADADASSAQVGPSPPQAPVPPASPTPPAPPPDPGGAPLPPEGGLGSGPPEQR